MSEIRLNLGAGDIPVEGYTPIDRKLGSEIYPLEYPDGSVDEIRASHVLEHVSHRETAMVLKHWVQKLKPGGRLRIAVPNFRWVAENYLAGKPINVQGYLMGGHVDENDMHGAQFDGESLAELLFHSGLERIGAWKSDVDDCASLAVSLNLQGFKPLTTDRKLENVQGVLSAPRFGPIMHFGVAFRALQALNVPYLIGNGAYWHQVLSEQIEQLLADPKCEYVLTLDYDSVFTAQDVLELYRILKAFPQIDAVCGLQMKRNCADALFSVRDTNGDTKRTIYRSEFQKVTTPLRTGHFGLTLIRKAALERMPRPWFEAKPSETGRWGGDGKIDADVNFWLKWESIGNTLHMANKVVIGHLQEVIVWPTQDFKPVYQIPGDYHENGYPAEVAR